MRIIKNVERLKKVRQEIADNENDLINKISALIKLTKEGEWDSPFIQRFKEQKLAIPETKYNAATLTAKWQPLLTLTTLEPQTKSRLAFILEIEANMCWAYLEKTARTANEMERILGIPNTSLYFKAILKAAESMK